MMRKNPNFAILIALWLFVAGVFAITVEAAKPCDVWDGTTATGFESGTGTRQNPIVIKTGEQLAYLAKTVNEGNYYAGKYFKLANDIMLNDASLSFDVDTGLVRVSDGTNIGYLGTGIWGDKSGTNTVFDTRPSKRGAWYVSDEDETKGTYSGVINKWTAIGTTIDNKHPFCGTFDGAGHTVSGIYIDNDKSCQGLFGYSNGTIKNIRVTGSYIHGGDYVGGIVGYNDEGTVRNCHNIGAVSGHDYVGGVVGNDEGRVEACRNAGAVSGQDYVGGVVGKNATKYYEGRVEACRNAGTVRGGNDVGGVAGKGLAVKCCNIGMVSGVGGVGGLVGEGSALNCYNTGTVSGYENVGGVVGKGGAVQECYNVGTVGGHGSSGGVIGIGNVINSYYLDGCGSAGKGTCLTVEKMKKKSSFFGFDFNLTWRMDPGANNGYPVLRHRLAKGCGGVMTCTVIFTLAGIFGGAVILRKKKK